ncbi:MAG: hypothetical protein ABL860_07435, partial [Candidatus Nitrotoga sp.]
MAPATLELDQMALQRAIADLPDDSPLKRMVREVARSDDPMQMAIAANSFLRKVHHPDLATQPGALAWETAKYIRNTLSTSERIAFDKALTPKASRRDFIKVALGGAALLGTVAAARVAFNGGETMVSDPPASDDEKASAGNHMALGAIAAGALLPTGLYLVLKSLSDLRERKRTAGSPLHMTH